MVICFKITSRAKEAHEHFTLLPLFVKPYVSRNSSAISRHCFRDALLIRTVNPARYLQMDEKRRKLSNRSASLAYEN